MQGRNSALSHRGFNMRHWLRIEQERRRQQRLDETLMGIMAAVLLTLAAADGAAESLEVSMGMENELRPGDMLPNGAVIVAAQPVRDGHVVLAIASPASDFAEYVTWFVIGGHAHWGHYHKQNFAAAIKGYQTRCAC